MDFHSVITEVFVRRKMVKDSCKLLGADKMALYFDLISNKVQTQSVSLCRGAEPEQRTRPKSH